MAVEDVVVQERSTLRVNENILAHTKNYAYYWGAALLLVIAEYFLFKSYILREIAPFYPRQYDQTWFLAESYKLYENMIANGMIFKAIQHQIQLPQTLLFHTQAAFFYLLFGPSRVTALSINFIYFALVQLFSFSTFKKISGTYLYGFIFIAVLLASKILTFSADFRTDFISFCLYGMFCCAVLRSEVFLSRKWTVTSILIAAFLICMRYIAACYLVGVGLVLLSYYVGRRMLEGKVDNVGWATRTRIKNLWIFNGSILLVCLVLFWQSYQILYHYYVVGHVTGPEKLLRLKAALAATGLHNASFYYPLVFIQYHFPPQLFYNFGIVFAVFGLVLLANKFYSKPALVSVDFRDYVNPMVFLSISILVPFVLLTLDEAKSWGAIGIVLVPCIYLLMLGLMALAEKISLLSPARSHYLLIATVLFLFWPVPGRLLQTFSHIPGHTSYDKQTYYDDANQVVSRWINDIGDYASYLHWRTFSIAQMEVADFMSAPIVPFYYETHGVILDPSTGNKLGGQLFAVSKEDAIEGVQHSDIFFSDMSTAIPKDMYDFDRSLVPYRKLLRDVAKEQMIKLGDYYYAARVIPVYAKPDFYLSGNLGKLFMIQGMWLNFPGVVAQQVSAVQLEGDADFKWLGQRKLTVSAEREVNKGKVVPVKADMVINNGHYRITCELPDWESNSPLVIHLTFSESYPAGIYQAVLPMPTKKLFLLKNSLEKKWITVPIQPV